MIRDSLRHNRRVNKRYIRVLSKPFAVTFSYGIGLSGVCLLFPDMPKRYQYLLMAPFLLLMGRATHISLRVWQNHRRRAKLSPGPVRFFRWGNWMVWGALAAITLFEGCGLSRSWGIIPIAASMTGCGMMILGGLWGAPGDYQAWQRKRETKRVRV